MFSFVRLFIHWTRLISAIITDSSSEYIYEIRKTSRGQSPKTHFQKNRTLGSQGKNGNLTAIVINFLKNPLHIPLVKIGFCIAFIQISKPFLVGRRRRLNTFTQSKYLQPKAMVNNIPPFRFERRGRDRN